MRIISGMAKGRRLFAPQGEETRPTSDKIRESLFNILSGRVWDARVLDLFGGTGAMALEALSRGAECAVIVDASPKAMACIRRNADLVLGGERDRRLMTLQCDYRTAIGRMPGEGFDLVFLDPPYRMTDAYGDALVRLRDAGLLRPDFRAVLEYLRGARPELPDGFEVYDERHYGGTSVALVREAEQT